MKRLNFICDDGHVTELSLQNDKPLEEVRCPELICDEECGEPVEVYWPSGESPVWSFRGPIRDL
jgi:hypothetical protein